MMLTAVGGPAINFALAMCFALAFKALHPYMVDSGELGWLRRPVELIGKMSAYGVFINLTLGLFNLIPLYPLDGHHIWRGFLSFKAALAYDKTKQAGGYVLMGIILVSFAAGISVIRIPAFFIINLVFTNSEKEGLGKIFEQLF
jgi:Zn-dependent protease